MQVQVHREHHQFGYRCTSPFPLGLASANVGAQLIFVVSGQ